MAETGPITPSQRRLAERRLVHALQRLHRREPMQPNVRVDTLLAAVRAAPRPASGHRGATPLTLDDAALRAVVDDLVAAGTVLRQGHRVWLPDHRPSMDPEMRERVDRLLDGLRESRAEPPRIDGIAARLGITPSVLAQLRQSGELVSVGPGIDYPRDVWEWISERLNGMGRGGVLNVGHARDELRTTRRHAEAILAHWRAEKRRLRSRRPTG
jgi:hypothetical protein